MGNYIRQTFRYGKAEEYPFRIRHFMFIYTLSFITDPFDSSKNIPQISKVEVCPKDISLLQSANDVTVEEATPTDIYKDFFDDPYINWMIQTDDPAAPHRISCGMSMKYLDLWDDPVAGWLLRTQIIDKLDPDIGSLILLNLVIRKNKDRWRSSN
ncbi:hypothetical protein QCA50_003828 [Cerrena zonata]|uniref:Uncharacterized protein n=1 Tax=Cerrena zonata TaxID=2478898 RepID=A0AAW0GK69_9APHY